LLVLETLKAYFLNQSFLVGPMQCWEHLAGQAWLIQTSK